MNCGECLMRNVEIVQLIDGICPKCGADYQAEVGISQTKNQLQTAAKTSPPVGNVS